MGASAIRPTPDTQLTRFYRDRLANSGVGVDGPRRHRLCQDEVVADLKQRGPSVEQISRIGIDMSGRRPLIKGYFAALRLIVGAVMSSACLMRVMTPVGPDVVR